MEIIKISALIISGLICVMTLGVIIAYQIPFPGDSPYPVSDDGELLLSHSIKINTTPEKIWDFFLNIEETYTAWHPDDHILFKWTKGQPWEKGSTIYSEQYMAGDITKYKGTVIEVQENEKIVIGFSFPISLFTKKIEWRLDAEGQSTTFTAITYLKYNLLFGKIFKNQIDQLIDSQNRHVAEEGDNLKKILETTSADQGLTPLLVALNALVLHVDVLKK